MVEAVEGGEPPPSDEMPMEGGDLEPVKALGGVIGLGEEGGHGGVRGRPPCLESGDLVQDLLHHRVEGFELLRQRLHGIGHLGFESSRFPQRQDGEISGVWWKKFGEKIGERL